MKLPVLHNFKAIQGEVISLNIGYNNTVSNDNLFACVRKLAHDEEYKAKFNIDVSEDDLEVGKYQWDLFLWSGDHPIKCLVKGQVNIIEGISNRGK